MPLNTLYTNLTALRCRIKLQIQEELQCLLPLTNEAAQYLPLNTPSPFSSRKVTYILLPKHYDCGTSIDHIPRQRLFCDVKSAPLSLYARIVLGSM